MAGMRGGVRIRQPLAGHAALVANPGWLRRVLPTVRQKGAWRCESDTKEGLDRAKLWQDYTYRRIHE
jgi:hypothetical protein